MYLEGYLFRFINFWQIHDGKKVVIDLYVLSNYNWISFAINILSRVCSFMDTENMVPYIVATV